jgi:integrase
MARSKRELRELYAIARAGALPRIKRREDRATPTWSARWHGGDGTRPRKDFADPDEFTAFCLAWGHLEEVNRSKDRGEYTDPARARVTLEVFFERWIKHARLEPSTKALYRQEFSTHLAPKLGSHQLAKITRRAVKEWVAELEEAGVGARTIGVTHALLRKLLNAAIDDEILVVNAAQRVPVPRDERREVVALEAAEVGRLADAIGERDRALVLLLAFGGLRVGEALALRGKDVDLPPEHVEVGDAELSPGRVRIERALHDVGGRVFEGPTKTRASRSIGIPRFLADELRAHVKAYSDPGDPEARVFAAVGGGPVRLGNWRRRTFQPAACAAGLGDMVRGVDGKERYRGVRIHDLRHTCASLLIAKGADVVEIAKRLGHSSPGITMTIYSHLLASRDQALTAALEDTFRQAATEVKESTVTEIGGRS